MTGDLNQPGPNSPYPITPRRPRGPNRPWVVFGLSLVLAGVAFGGGFWFGQTVSANTAISIPVTANTTFNGPGAAAMSVTTGCGTQSAIDIWVCTETVTNTGDTARTITSIYVPCGGTETRLPLQIAAGGSAQLDVSADVTVVDQESGSLNVQIAVSVT